MFVGDTISIEQAARIVHISMLMMCFLIVMVADLTAAKSMSRSLTQKDLTLLHKCHGALAFGLVFFWLSGLILIEIRTGFEWAEFTPKLLAKLFVVSILTINASLIGRYALPFYEKRQGLLFGELKTGERLRLSVCAGVSSASWFSAFCLGIIPALKTAPADTLIALLGTVYLAALTFAAILASVTGRRASIIEPIRKEVIFGTSRTLSHTSRVMSRPRSVRI